MTTFCDRVFAVSAERDQWETLVVRIGRESYHAGETDGYRRGYEAACRAMDQSWNEAARPFRNMQRPDQAVLEQRRWGPRGRTHFGDPQPGDRTPSEMVEKARASWGLMPPAEDGE